MPDIDTARCGQHDSSGSIYAFKNVMSSFPLWLVRTIRAVLLRQSWYHSIHSRDPLSKLEAVICPVENGRSYLTLEVHIFQQPKTEMCSGTNVYER